MDFNQHLLGREYLRFCSLRDSASSDGFLNLDDIDFFYPTLLLPLSVFCQDNQDITVLPHLNANLNRYYSIITGEDISPGDTYLPIRKIPTERKEDITTQLCNIEDGNCIGGTNAFMYIVGELISNVYEHSEFSNAYIMAQRYDKKKFLDITIVDNGISIPQCLMKGGYEFEDPEAIWHAINGLSTKCPPDERGFGLKSSIELLTEGLDAKCLIVSRNGGFIGEKEDKHIYKMEGTYGFSGTLISVRVPFHNEKVNIYDFISE